MLGFPAITLRPSIERPEAVEAGTILLSDLDPAQVTAAVAMAINNHPIRSAIPDYDIPNTSDRVVSFIESTAGVHRQWAGLR